MSGILDELKELRTEMDQLTTRLNKIAPETPEQPDYPTDNRIDVIERQISTLNRSVYDSKWANTGKMRVQHNTLTH